ncbi:telomeric repeat-binding factor 2-interacting protein 1 [Scyliorhinus canicula]|uniref:telomeric repeat-binding factor 2-interacting protein 1 n=1 Tax=Scyliorhinus canicula TaxID=7830 RepID=UPI0018F632DA|nr:telomeric repeat-binding factor 2-interacting protein 1 [Scyliorhinus canicula]
METSAQTPSHSRTLFLSDKGAPLRFYAPPGPTKSALFPLVVHGGAVMCRHQETGAILLDRLEETGPLPKGYTRARYVLDCVERNQQLPLEGYQAAAASLPAPQEAKPSVSRMFYTKLDDVAILMYLRDYAEKDGGPAVHGNVVWQQMERLQLTAHSWQSMRNRYVRYLCGHEHLYQLDSRSVIPTAVFPKLRPLEETGAEPTPGEGQLADEGTGKKNPDGLQHPDGLLRVNLESNEEANASVEQGSDDVNSEEECYNIFPVAIREFELEDDTPELLVDIGNEVEAQVPREQPMETDKSLQVNPAEHRPKHKGTLAEFVMDNEQSDLDSQTPADMLSSMPTASQDEVESAIRAINTLMKAHNMDLSAATQLLLKNSGEFTAAKHFMETGHRPDGYAIWTHKDDLDLENVDRIVQERLIQKFGSENLAKRIAFRKS